MQEHTTIPFPLPPRTAEDPLTAVLRQGAQRLLAQAIEVEVAILLARYTDRRDIEGRQAIVRNGSLPERDVQTGIGAVRVKVPRVRDRSGTGIRFHSALLPPYIRRSKSLEALLPWLYLKGVSTGDFSEALQALLGPDAPGLSPATLSRLNRGGKTNWRQWQRRDLTGKRYVYFWVDGVYLEPGWRKRGIAFSSLLVQMPRPQRTRRPLGWLPRASSPGKSSSGPQKPRTCAGARLGHWDGALGFWKALRHVYGQTRWQRCWVHKTANVFDKLPKDLQAQATQRLQAIWMAPDRQRAGRAFDLFIATYEAKYPKAAKWRAQDREELLAFYDFPAEHWATFGRPIRANRRLPPCAYGQIRPEDVSPAPRGWRWCSNSIRVPPRDGIGYGLRMT